MQMQSSVVEIKRKKTR